MNIVPISAFRVPGGMIGVTLDVHECPRFSVALPVEAIEGALRDTEQNFKLTPKHRSDPATHVRIRNAIAEALKSLQPDKDNAMLQGIGITALWLALNHPTGGNSIRAQVAEELRRKGKAHITVSSDQRKTWAFALADQFVDMEKLMEAAPPDRVITITTQDGKPKTELH